MRGVSSKEKSAVMRPMESSSAVDFSLDEPDSPKVSSSSVKMPAMSVEIRAAPKQTPAAAPKLEMRVDSSLALGSIGERSSVISASSSVAELQVSYNHLTTTHI